MTRFKIGAAALGLMIGLLGAAPANAWYRGHVDVLAVLPPVTTGVLSSVEGLTVGPDGNIYVPSFGANTETFGTFPVPNAVLYVISPSGKIIRQVTIAKSSPHMLGLAFDPAGPNKGHLLVLDFGSGLATGTANVLDVDPMTGNSTVFATAPTISGSGTVPGINALTFDTEGNVYVSDSFQGVIWKGSANGGGGPMTVWSPGPLLGPGMGLTPPFGANGVEFNKEHTILFVADTAFHQIIQIPVNSGGTAGTPSIFVTGINAPDGIMIDRNDNIWICANQEDEIVVVDKTGKVIAKLGDFYGIDQNGIAQGFLFPASLAFSPDGSTLYVSNLTLYLPYAGANLAIDSAWTLQVKGYTVSQLPAIIPPIPGGGQ